MAATPHYTYPKRSGSSRDDVLNEPDWAITHSHRIGFRDRDDRHLAHTHTGDDWDPEQEREFLAQAKQEAEELSKKLREHDLINVRDYRNKQEDYHLRLPQKYPQGWRYVLHTTEDFIKYQQNWPVNEYEWRRSRGENDTHNESHARYQQYHDDRSERRGKYQESGLQDKYSPQELSLLHLLQSESVYMETLKENDGNVKPPVHYVRNHGPVSHLLWETHQLDVEGRNLVLSMDDLASNYETINIVVAMACDGNWRKELDMIRRSKGFDWGAGAISCAFWKGPLLRDVLLAAGIQCPDPLHEKRLRWVHFEGADNLREAKYATSIPSAYVMDSANDVIMAYEMNNVRLPPDHGYPVRLAVSGYIGGRWVKWLQRIWVSDKENNSHFHIWDNRVLPSFIRDKDSEFSHIIFYHPSTACNKQNLNSIIVRPGHGIAYDVGGHEVQRMEVSLDGGKTRLYCVCKFPEYPVRHGHKFWTWLHWYVDVAMPHLVRAESIIVRMMNNCWYIVLPEILDSEGNYSMLFFGHPCEPGTGAGGWMQPSTENRIESIKHEASSPQKQFTREEIEKHNKENDCWIFINGKVYNATSVLDWHPGGKAPIMTHAGRAHPDTTNDFESIHDDYAEQRLSGTAQDAANEKANHSNRNLQTAFDCHRWNVVRFGEKEQLSEDTRRYTFVLPASTKKLGLGTSQHLQLGFHFSDRLVVRPYTPTRPVFETEEDGTFDLVVKTYVPDQSQPG
ncbi:unnamed protein product [Penicillium crustosum]